MNATTERDVADEYDESGEEYTAGLPGDCSDILTVEVRERLAKAYRLA